MQRRRAAAGRGPRTGGLEIDGPDRIAVGDHQLYLVRAVDGRGEPMSLSGDDRIAWSSSPGWIAPAHCSDMPVLGCPGPDMAEVSGPAGTLTIIVRYLGLRFVKQVAVSQAQ